MSRARPVARLLAAVLLVLGALAALLMVGRSPAASAPNLGGLVLGQVQADAAGGTLWLTNEDSGHGTTLYTADGATGAIRAQLSLGRVTVGQVLYAEGWLWVTVAPETGRGGPAPALLRVEPDTLQVLSTAPLRARQLPATLASAGASIWVGDGGTLGQATAIGGNIVRRIALPHVREVKLGTGGPEELLVSAGNGSGLAHIERRDGRTGDLQSTSPRYIGVTEPRLGGIAGGRLWISEATGMMGYVEQIDARTLRPRRAIMPPGQTTNGIRADVFAGVLYVHGGAESPSGDYCANPLTGRRRATLPRVLEHALVLTGDAHRLYVASDSVHSRLILLPIPAACR